MKSKKRLLLVIFASIFIFHPFLFAEKHYDYVISPKTDIYFGHISFSEIKHDGKDPVVIREGEESPEVAVVNFPLLPGDMVRTSDTRMCEIQFDTGTIIRLDVNTELKIETILADSLSARKKITNLLLNKGQLYIMYKRYSLPEIFQVVTPNAAVKMYHWTVAVIDAREDGSTAIQINLGKADVKYGTDADNIQETKVMKSESLTVTKDHKPLLGEVEEDVDFGQWNESMNKNFEKFHEGISALPKPISRFPPAVRYFAQKYSSLYGEWVWDDLYGYVWRPFYNDRYPWGTWSPYYYGSWREASGQLFWVPEEPWGWVPYHLGLWVWSKKHGWLWIPGSAFAPAWVTWSFYMDYYWWSPWSLYDWYYQGLYGYPYYYSGGSYYGYRVYYLPPAEGKKPKTLTKIRKDQLKRNQTLSSQVPKELKSIVKRAIVELKNGNPEALESLRRIQDSTVVVRKEDLNATRIQRRTLNYRDISPQLPNFNLPSRVPSDPYREAVRAFRKNEASASLEDRVVRQILTFQWGKIPQPSKISSQAFRSSMGNQSRMRFRDWNPDVRVAQRARVTIKYDSRHNEVRCPELKLTSRTARVMRNPMASFSSSRSGSSSGSSSGVSSSSGSSSSSSSSSRGTHSSGSKSSSSGSKSSGSRGSTKKH